jgi:DNA-binding response OmpR family regulator
LKVFVIEDDRHVAELMREQLSIAGIHASIYHDGRVALPVILHHQADLVICDIGLRYGDGFILAQDVLEKLECCKVILISGSAISEEGQRLMANYERRCIFLKKPFFGECLIGTLQKLLTP